MSKFSINGLIVVILLLGVSPTYAQKNNNLDFLPAIISFLLDANQCPAASASEMILSGIQVIRSQEDLNQLSGTTKIDGDLIIEGDSLHTLDFSPLDSLLFITGDLEFNTDQLIAIDGFNCLLETGNLFIDSNNTLSTIDGFSSLTSTTVLSISDNDALINIPDFTALTTVRGSLFLANNNALTNLSGFSALTFIGGTIFLEFNDALTSISGFEALTAVVGTLFLELNDTLTTISGFSALTSIGGTLFLESNEALTTLAGFSALTSVGSDLNINNNDVLTSIAGFNSLSRPGVTNHIFVNGNSLFDCSSDPAPSFLPVTDSVDNEINCSTE